MRELAERVVDGIVQDHVSGAESNAQIQGRLICSVTRTLHQADDLEQLLISTAAHYAVQRLGIEYRLGRHDTEEEIRGGMADVIERALRAVFEGE